MYETPEISLLLLRTLRFCKVPIIYGNTFCDGKTLRTFGLGAGTPKLIVGSIQTVQHHRTDAWLAVRDCRFLTHLNELASKWRQRSQQTRVAGAA